MFYRFFVFWAALSVGVVSATAQDACTTIVEDALALLGDNCAGLARNTACYGYQQVDAMFRDVENEVPFGTPADRAPLDIVQAVNTAPYQAAAGQWGIAVMNLQAELEGTLPGQGVTLLVLGGASVAEDAEAASEFPMQAFTFTGGIGVAACDRAPAGMAVRTPAGTSVELEINGQGVRLGSTMVMFDNRDGTYTTVMTDGTMTMLTDDTEMTVGDAMDMTVDPDTGEIIEYGKPRPATDDERTAAGGLAELIDTVAPDETAVATHTVQPGENMFRIALENNTCVSALAAANSIPASQVRDIPVGRTLTIPGDENCGLLVNDIPLIGSAPPTTTGEETETTGEFDCSGFRVTSPRDGLPLGVVTFYWEGVPGAAAYEVALSRGAASIYRTVVDAPTTTATTDLSDQPPSPETYTWTVAAFGTNGAPLCTAASPPMLREWESQPGGAIDDGNSGGTTPSGGSGPVPPSPFGGTVPVISVCNVAVLNATATSVCTAAGLSVTSTDTAACSYTCG